MFENQWLGIWDHPNTKMTCECPTHSCGCQRELLLKKCAIKGAVCSMAITTLNTDEHCLLCSMLQKCPYVHQNVNYGIVMHSLNFKGEAAISLTKFSVIFQNEMCNINEIITQNI